MTFALQNTRLVAATGLITGLSFGVAGISFLIGLAVRNRVGVDV